MDRTMVLLMWVKYLQENIIIGGIGKPTFPLNKEIITRNRQHWEDREKIHSNSNISGISSAIDYGDPRGMPEAKKMMAEAMTRWYKLENTVNEIKPEHILFTIGGAGALRVIFETFNEMNKDTPAYRVITPVPLYTLYSDNTHTLHPIDIMNQPGYRLTAQALEDSIKKAYELALKDNNTPQYILLCNPNNPLSTVITEEEWQDIIPVLKAYPELTLVIDEAYAEMNWLDAPPSLLKLAPELQSRIVMLRSATKALSAAGERLAILIAFNPELMSRFLSKNIGMIGHSAISSQHAYASAMHHFTQNDALNLKTYYKAKQDYVLNRLKDMQALLPDPTYKPQGSFYAMADLSDLLGATLPVEAKQVFGDAVTTVSTSEHIAYFLLFEKKLMISPGQYYGLPANKGFMRLTCSGPESELADMMDRIESSLLSARKTLYVQYVKQITTQLKELNFNLSARFIKQFKEHRIPNSCADYAEVNSILKSLVSDIRVAIKQSQPAKITESALVILNFLKRKKEKTLTNNLNTFLDEKWTAFVEEEYSCKKIQTLFLNMKREERNSVQEWKKIEPSLIEKFECQALKDKENRPKHH